jgi:type IV secretion system protein VirB9
MKWLRALAFLGLSAMAAVAAEEPRPGVLDARVRFVAYNAFQVVLLPGCVSNSMQIEFAVGEEIGSVALGNAVWQATPIGNILFLKPSTESAPTNMSVVTTRKDGTRRSYQFEMVTLRCDTLKREPGSKVVPFFFVKFEYPSDDAAAKRLEAAMVKDAAKVGVADRVLLDAELNGPRNFQYTVQGLTPFEPSAVFDNGKITTFRFPQNMHVPAIFVVEGEAETLVPKSVRGNDVMVHVVGKKFVLRIGGEVLCIYNDGFVPGGVATGTMTTSPQVERIARSSVGSSR